MIGLGSNRLTVCRRGGMSVTQAGRGGMEWLAGGRRPSWASPYSAQATAALKAQFPTQWPTIRDYGFSHPEIVPYVNQYPVGWGNIIVGYQLCEYIYTNGENGIRVTLPESGLIFDFITKKTGAGTAEVGCAGYSDGSYTWADIYISGGKIYEYHDMNLISPASGSSVSDNTILSIKARMNYSSYLNIGQYNFNNRYIYLGNIYRASLSKEVSGEGVHDLYPCYNKTSGVIGMYDVVTNEFKTNFGSGSFQKGSDVYYPFTPS